MLAPHVYCNTRLIEWRIVLFVDWASCPSLVCARAAMNVVAFTTHFLMASRIRPSNKMRERNRAGERGRHVDQRCNASPCAQKKADSLSALFSHWSPPTAKQQAASPVGLDGGGGSYLSRGSLLSPLPSLSMPPPPPVAKFH